MTAEVIDLSARTEPGLRVKLAAWYRELSDDNRALGLHALADEAEIRASALEFGGTITIGKAEP